MYYCSPGVTTVKSKSRLRWVNQLSHATVSVHGWFELWKSIVAAEWMNMNAVLSIPDLLGLETDRINKWKHNNTSQTQLLVHGGICSGKGFPGSGTFPGGFRSGNFKFFFKFQHFPTSVGRLLSIAVACATVMLNTCSLTWVWSLAYARKLSQVNSGTYAIGLISWPANCHQTV